MRLGECGQVELRVGRAYVMFSWAAPLGRIQQLYVPRELRGRGLGSALASIAEDVMRLAGVRVVQVPALEESRGFWERLGYSEARSERGWALLYKELE